MINILVCCNKNDYYLTKICVGSIRYYYPDVPIYILKDESNGIFNTTELQKAWNVSPIEYPEKKFGWSASKMFFYTDQRFKGQRFLVLDSDIVFAGKILDQAWAVDFKEDVIVSYDSSPDPYLKWFTDTYFDIKIVEATYPDFVYQGYTFNCGQLFCKPGFIERSTVEEFFDFNDFPRWKRPDLWPLVDQSLFNFLLPSMERKGLLSIGKQPYMYWSEGPFVPGLELQKIKEGHDYPVMIHWAGALRIPDISKMTRSDILDFFEAFYYSKVLLGRSKRFIRRSWAATWIALKKAGKPLYNSLKRIRPTKVS